LPLPIASITPQKRSVEFGIYRDGDNNLDEAQAPVLDQAKAVSEADARIAFHVEDTTARDDHVGPEGLLRTEDYTLVDGQQRDIELHHPQDMADRTTLARFVAKTLDEAESHHSATTWLDLVDHGGGDGGAFQTNLSGGHVMREDDIAGAIADGVQLHAREHPEDGDRQVTGVLLNACLMATCGVESALSHVGVRYLAASPETMIAPGAPTSVAEDIADHQDDPDAMAKSIVRDTMSTHYGIGEERFAPAAAFDVFDLQPQKIAAMEQSIKQLNQEIIVAAKDPAMKSAIKADGRQTEGMTRSQEPGLPWHADRPAEALYRTLSADTRLSSSLRTAASDAAKAVKATVLAHAESRDFAPFDDANYRDAAGPTIHFPTTKGQIDPWAPVVSETKNVFAQTVDALKAERALA